MPLTRQHFWGVLVLYFICTSAILLVAPFIGSEPISLHALLDNSNPVAQQTAASIFFQQRIPRVILGFLVGGTLSLVGSVFQVILRNPLASPSTLGVASGSALGATLAISFPRLQLTLGPFSSVQVFALLGAALVVFLIYRLARTVRGISINTLLLAGVTLSILCSAIIPLLKYLANPDLLVAMDRWMMGGLDIIGYQQLAGILPFILPGVGLLFLQMNTLNHLALGEEMSLGQGVDVYAVQRTSFFAASLATAGAVSLAGPVMFVGLIVPHIVRMLSGNDHRIILPASFLAGGGFLVLCDLLARTLVAPTEIPVGIITALLGGPFFLYLLIRQK